jgi:adenylate cyclase
MAQKGNRRRADIARTLRPYPQKRQAYQSSLRPSPTSEPKHTSVWFFPDTVELCAGSPSVKLQHEMLRRTNRRYRFGKGNIGGGLTFLEKDDKMLGSSILETGVWNRRPFRTGRDHPQVWPTRTNPTLAWLANGTCDEEYLENIFFNTCRRLEKQGVPVTRAAVFLKIDHLQCSGLHVSWRHEMSQPKVFLPAHGARSEDCFYERSLVATTLTESKFRIRLDELLGLGEDRELSECMRRECLTDYVAWPLQFTRGKRHLISFATNRSCGFSDDDLLDLAELLPVLSSIMEIRLKDRLARDLLDAYVGPHAGDAILAGATRRGNGMTVEAAVIMVDLRGFTSICEQSPGNDLIAMLNDYFDAVSEPIERHGGEILKLMGDGLLAVFPHDAVAASRAVSDICKAMASLNAVRETQAAGALQFGIGGAYGAVVYSNIGSRSRLDFTVIGPAVNVAARLEELTKVVGRNVLFSDAFVAKAAGCSRLECFGEFELRGVGRPIEVYGFCPSTDTAVQSMQADERISWA